MGRFSLAGRLSTTIYDSNSRVVASIDPLGNRASYAYDAVGRQVRAINAMGKVTTSLYDAAGRPVASINALGSRTSQVYDAASQQLAGIDPRSNRTSYAYDATGHLTRMTDPVGNRTTYQYDAAGRQALRTNGRGLRTSYLYDATDRLTGQKYQDGTRATMTYDAVGRRTALNDWTGRTSSSYEADGRLIRVINPAGLRITYGYDTVGQQLRMIAPGGGLFTYVYDAAGRARRLINPEGQVTSWSYDAAGRVTVNRLANGTRASYSYDDVGQILRLSNLKSNGMTLSSFDYKYDKAGNRTRVVEANGVVVTWTYDSIDQLTSERRSGANGYAITYTYDAAGNRLTKWNGSVRSTYVYDAANQLTRYQEPGGYTTSVYDGAGNMAITRSFSSQRTTYSWDNDNRLTKVKLPSGTINTIAYNSDGQRVQKQDSSGTAKHVWDRQNVLLETDGNNIVQVAYTLELAEYGKLISQNRGSMTSYYHFDGLGSTDRLSDSSGTVTDSYGYGAFGEVVPGSGDTINPYKYGGQSEYYYDLDTALCYLRARYYDPTRGRFLSRDSLGLVSSDANIYCYVRNNPILLIDPSGLIPQVSVRIPPVFSEPGTCGGGAAFIEWVLDPNLKNADGWILQHVRVNIATQDCSNNKNNPCIINYWEAWRVSVRGGVVKGRTPSDEFRLPATIGHCSKGNATITGHARFVALQDIHPPGKRRLPGWIPGMLREQTGACKALNNFNMSSLSLLRTSSKDKIKGIWDRRWENNPYESTFHQLSTKWDCCPPCPGDRCPDNPSDVRVFIPT